MNFEKVENLGVQDVEIDNNNYYKVSILWKDREKSVMSFPTNGFEVVDLNKHQKVGYLKGDEALNILKNYSSKYNREDFSFLDFLNKDKY